MSNTVKFAVVKAVAVPFALALALFAGPASWANDVESDVETAAVEADPVVDQAALKAERKRRAKKVCKRERKTGSRVREKVCRTVGAIEDRAKRNRTDVDLMTRNARPGNLQ